MPIELEEISASRKQSIARVELFTDANMAPDDWRLVVHFEDALYDAQGVLMPGTQSFGTRQVVRRFGDIKDQIVSAGAAKVSVAQLAGLISAAAYQFRQADIEAEAAKAKAVTP